MKIIISPAKKLNYEEENGLPTKASEIAFAKESTTLIKKLKKLKPSEVGDLMKISAGLADLNYQRYQDWSYPFDPTKSKQAAFAFDGEVYTGLDIRSFNDQELVYAQDNLRILSGLYGMLKPLDKVLPYRLEMGTKFQTSESAKNLYQFWGDQLTKSLTSEMEDDELLLNLASNEYNKVLDLKSFGDRVITPVFKEQKGDTYKVIMVYAKKARGLMTQYALKNQVSTLEDIMNFDVDGYQYNVELTAKENQPVFTR